MFQLLFEPVPFSCKVGNVGEVGVEAHEQRQMLGKALVFPGHLQCLQE